MERFFLTKHVMWLLIISVLLQAYASRGCLEQERVALLQLKAYIMSVSTSANEELSSWSADGEANCCMWSRVKCDNYKQRVAELSLDSLNWHPAWVLNITFFQPFGELRILDLTENSIQRVVGSEGYKTLSLRNLEVLEFGYNHLKQLPDFIGSLTSLKNLSLASNDLSGRFPTQVIGNLKELQVLDLSHNQLNGSLTGQGLCELKNLQKLSLAENSLSDSLPPCLGNLTSLQVLDLEGNSLSGDIASIISNLKSLEYLSILDNSFHGEFSFNFWLNHSKLEVLILSHSGLHVKTDDLFYSPTFQLKHLELSECNLNIASRNLLLFLLHQQNLIFIDISYNGLFGPFPTWLLQNNSNIEVMTLNNNSFEGVLSLPAYRENHSLGLLDVSRNQFSGQLPASFGIMTNLWYLDLSNNNFSGEIPRAMFTNCTSLTFLMLSDNGLQGDIIPGNMNLTRLRVLFLGNNHFSGTIQRGLVDSRYLIALDISDTEVAGDIPSWIGNLSRLCILSLSNNQLHGQIPCELFNFESLHFLDLSSNRLVGMMPSCYNLSQLSFLHMHNNFLIGPIPFALSKSSHLLNLDLRNNKFSGGIPLWINHLSKLKILLLGHNLLEGKLPSELCHLHHINIMDLSSNGISGVIPTCLANMSFGTVTPDYFRPFRVIPITSMSFETVTPDDFRPLNFSFKSSDNIVVTKEVLEGDDEATFLTKSRPYSYKGNILRLMSGLDLSCNQLTGEIPQELGHMDKIRALNLSHNQLYGSIPSSFSKFKKIESLDLSNNNMSGAIPSQLAELNFLEIFNVSYNNLSGSVPKTGQFANFDESNYKGNPFLYGFVGQHRPTPSKGDTEEDREDNSNGEFDWEVFFWSFGVSSATIFLAFILVLWINPHWRRAWFLFIDLHMLWWLNLPS